MPNVWGRGRGQNFGPEDLTSLVGTSLQQKSSLYYYIISTIHRQKNNIWSSHLTIHNTRGWVIRCDCYRLQTCRNLYFKIYKVLTSKLCYIVCVLQCKFSLVWLHLCWLLPTVVSARNWSAASEFHRLTRLCVMRPSVQTSSLVIVAMSTSLIGVCDRWQIWHVA